MAWGASLAPKQLVIATDRVGVFLGDRVAVGGLEGVGLFRSGQLGTQLGLNRDQRGEDFVLHLVPSGGDSVRLECATHVLSLGAGIIELLTEIRIIDQLFHGAETVGPGCKILTRERAALRPAVVQFLRQLGDAIKSSHGTAGTTTAAYTTTAATSPAAILGQLAALAATTLTLPTAWPLPATLSLTLALTLTATLALALTLAALLVGALSQLGLIAIALALAATSLTTALTSPAALTGATTALALTIALSLGAAVGVILREITRLAALSLSLASALPLATALTGTAALTLAGGIILGEVSGLSALALSALTPAGALPRLPALSALATRSVAGLICTLGKITAIRVTPTLTTALAGLTTLAPWSGGTLTLAGSALGQIAAFASRLCRSAEILRCAPRLLTGPARLIAGLLAISVLGDITGLSALTGALAPLGTILAGLAGGVLATAVGIGVGAKGGTRYTILSELRAGRLTAGSRGGGSGCSLVAALGVGPVLL